MPELLRARSPLDAAEERRIRKLAGSRHAPGDHSDPPPPRRGAVRPGTAPTQIITWFVARWPLEVTFHEVRAHLGVETQRQWSDLAILRTTPALLGLFSLVTLFAQASLHGQSLPVRQAAWYAKTAPTFSDTLAFVRQPLWPVTVFSTSPSSDDVIEIPRALFDRLTDTLAFAA